MVLFVKGLIIGIKGLIIHSVCKNTHVALDCHAKIFYTCLLLSTPSASEYTCAF